MLFLDLGITHNSPRPTEIRCEKVNQHNNRPLRLTGLHQHGPFSQDTVASVQRPDREQAHRHGKAADDKRSLTAPVIDPDLRGDRAGDQHEAGDARGEEGGACGGEPGLLEEYGGEVEDCVNL